MGVSQCFFEGFRSCYCEFIRRCYSSSPSRDKKANALPSMAGATISEVYVLDLAGLVILISISGVVGMIGNARGHKEVPYGWLGAIVVGFLGSSAGTQLLTGLGPSVAQVPLIPAVLGATVFVYLLEFVLGTFIRMTTT